jgi:beta-glucanase (GH16 family)
MIKFKYFKTVLLFFSAMFISCGTETDGDSSTEWELTWSDEFNGEAGELPDAANWTFDLGTGENGWGNRELQYYTDRTENISLDGEGNLVIKTLKEPFNGSSYTSARIKTEGLFSQEYGRFEARIKTPFGRGIWPAFWMLGSNFSEVGWPQTGEIDIMEFRGQEPSRIHGSLHGPGYSAGNAVTSTYDLANGRFDTNYNLFAVEWYEDRIDYFVNDIRYQSIERSDVNGEWVFDKPFFLILNVAVGGTFVGPPSEETPFPQELTVDYVRVYSRDQ